ncbi:MAG: DUF58 domain-containing protein [Actinomycetota bacterium]|nr:DUF58 domain-containing protein [Actinomycetota bacterium]
MSGLRAALAGLTTRGRCLLAAGLTLGLCAVLLGQRDLLRAAVFLVVLPLAAVALVARTRYRLACARSLEPARVAAGSPADVRLVLENVSRLPTGVLLMEDVLPYALGGRPRFVLDRVEPQGRRSVRYPVQSDARGRFVVGPLSVRLTDPFGLVELVRRFAETDELVVTPVVTPLPAVRLGGDWTGGGESSTRAVAASGTDDTATREYRHGDDLRRVHWKSTARVGELMVRREEQPFSSRATLLLDGRAEAHRGDGPGSSYERAVSAVASVGVALARAGFGLRLLDHAGHDLGPPGVPLTEAVLLDTLAAVTPERDAGLERAVGRLRSAGTDGALVAVLGRLSVDDAERLARLRTGTGTCIAVLLDPGDVGASGSPDDAVESLLAGTGWRLLRVDHDTSLARVWPLAAGRDAPLPSVR